MKSIHNTLRNTLFALASSAALAMCSQMPVAAQAINPPAPGGGSITAGTGLTLTGSVMSANYGLTSGTAIQGNQLIPVVNGGTGLASLAGGSIPSGNGAGAFVAVAPAAATTVLTSNGVGVAPSFQALPTSAANAVSLANVAALRAFSHLLSQYVTTQAFATAGDKGGNAYYMVSATTGAFVDDACNVIVASDGAVWSFANSKVINILSCGAKPDGVVASGTGTNNTTAIQNAITDATSAIQIPPGVFLTAQLTNPSATAIYGSGMGVSTLLSTTAFNTATGLVLFNGAGTAPTTIQNLTITAPTGGAGGSAVGVGVAAKHVFMTAVAVNNFNTNILVSATDADLASIETNGGATGISITPAFADGDVNVVNYHGYLATGTGILISGASSVQVLNSVIAAPTNASYATAGISVSSSDHVLIDGVILRLGVTSTTGVGVLVASSDYVNAQNCIVSGFFNGIQYTASTNAMIQGNNASSNGNIGISYTNTTVGNKLSANIIGNTTWENGNTTTMAAQTSAGILVNIGTSATNTITMVNSNMALGQTSSGSNMYSGINLTNNASSGFGIATGNISKYTGFQTITNAGSTPFVTTGNVL